MPYIQVRDVDGAIIAERQGDKPADGSGYTYHEFGAVAWDISLVNRDPSQFVDGAYSTGWLKIPIHDAKLVGGTATEMTPDEKATRTATTHNATRAAIKAQFRANPPRAALVAAIKAAGVTDAAFDALTDAEADKITDDELEARG